MIFPLPLSSWIMSSGSKRSILHYVLPFSQSSNISSWKKSCLGCRKKDLTSSHSCVSLRFYSNSRTKQWMRFHENLVPYVLSLYNYSPHAESFTSVWQFMCRQVIIILLRPVWPCMTWTASPIHKVDLLAPLCIHCRIDFRNKEHGRDRKREREEISEL